MVFAFMCHTVLSSHCRILFSDVYGSEVECESGDEYRVQLNTKLLQVAGRVQAEFNFRVSTHMKGPNEKEGDLVKLSQEEVQGLFRLPAGQPFSSLKVVAWLFAHNCAFVLILDDDENRILASHALLTISTLVKDYIIKDQPVAEVMLKPDKIALILMKFLPSGQLLFLNSKVVKQYEKEIEPYLKEKS